MSRVARFFRGGLEAVIARNARWLLFLYWPLLALSTHVPQTDLDPVDFGETGLDTPVHVVCFGLLTLLLIHAQRPDTPARPRILRAVVTAGAYAVIDELTQGYFGRDVTAGDLLSNFVGIALFAAAAWLDALRSAPEPAPAPAPAPAPEPGDHRDPTPGPLIAARPWATDEPDEPDQPNEQDAREGRP
jgi:VanZ family protein